VPQAQQIGSGCHGDQDDKGDRDIRLAACALRAVRRCKGDGRDAHDQGRHRERLARTDRLAQRASSQVEQEHQAKREHRLHDRERGESQGGDLQAEARHRQRDSGQPATAAGERGEQSRPPRKRGADAARLERLENVRPLVAACRDRGGSDAERQARPDHCEHPPMRLSLLAAGTAAAWSLPGLAPLIPSVSRLLAIPRRLPGDGVALTFDDGPHPQGTAAVLAVLDRFGAPATFFLTGEQVERAPRLAAEIADAGHAVALHGFRHRNMLRLSPGAVVRDLRHGQEAIAAATGRAPLTYRPPFGIFSAGGLAAARREGFEPILWSRWGRDWAALATPASIAAKVAGELRPRDVLLLHDADHYSAAGSWRNTVAALPRIIEAIEAHALRPERWPVTSA